MKNISQAALCCGFAVFALALQNSPAMARKVLPNITIALVGDSTVAPNGGWGDDFARMLKPQAKALNLAKGGRSSKSFRDEGHWKPVLDAKPDWVLIQFGHNDQPGKPGHSTDLATEFPANIARYAREARALGAVPVLVTPLTRRTFVGGQLDNNLRPWADAVLKVARQEHVSVLDLNADSHAAVQAMGQDEADTLAVAPRPAGWGGPAAPARTAFDRTHLGSKGAAYFARMVERELTNALPDLAAEFPPR